jgi:hypothetical protein
VKSSDLRGEAKQLFEEWRQLGYTEAQALDRVERSGLVQAPELYGRFRRLGLSQEAASTAALGRNPAGPTDVRGRTVEAFKGMGLSDRQAQIAADGRDGPSVRPVSEAGSLSSLRPDPSNVRHVVAAIEEIASGLCREGVAEDKALREAAVEMMLRVSDDRTADWVARVAQRFWPSVFSDLGSGSGSKNTQTRSVGETTRQPGRRTVSE